MEMNDTTNPEAEAPEAEAPEVDTEETLAADEADENDASESGEGEDEYEELDLDGDPLRVPKSAAEKLKARMMMQADYTQKTQALAEQRREIEAQRQATEWEAQTRQELFNEEAQLLSVRSRLNQFAQVNWQALANEDASQYAALHAEYTQLKDVHDGLAGNIDNRKGQLAAMREQATAISLERAVADLSRPDPTTGWDGKFDADKSRKITDFLVTKGANPDSLRTITDPFVIKMAHLAMIGDEALRKSNAALKKAAPEAKPVPTVTSGKTRTGPSNPDKLSADEWLKWRESQLARKQQRSR
jgi:hypothetical protein